MFWIAINPVEAVSVTLPVFERTSVWMVTPYGPVIVISPAAVRCRTVISPVLLIKLMPPAIAVTRLEGLVARTISPIDSSVTSPVSD